MYWTELKIRNIVAIDNRENNWETYLFRGWDSGIDERAIKNYSIAEIDKWWYEFERGWKITAEMEDMETIFVKVVAEVMWAKHHCHVSWVSCEQNYHCHHRHWHHHEALYKGTEGVIIFVNSQSYLWTKSKLDKVPWKKDQKSVKNRGHWVIWKTG